MISMSKAWDKEKIWIPDRIQTYDLPNPRRALLSYGELMESKAMYWVHIWHASCILLGSAMSMSPKWKMVNVKLGETNVKMIWSTCHECGTKKTSEFPTGFSILMTWWSYHFHICLTELNILYCLSFLSP